MKFIEVPLVTPKRLRGSQFARNGVAPSAAADSLLATQINHLIRNKRKMVFSHGLRESQKPAGSVGTTERLRFYFLTGTGAVGIRIRAAVTARSYSASTVPRLKLDLTDVVAATTATTYINLPSAYPGTFGVNELHHVDQVIAADEKKAYHLVVSDVDGTRVLSICGVDVSAAPSDDEAFYLPAVSSVGKPITAARHNLMRDVINDLYAYNGPHLIAWAAHGGVETVSTSGGSLVRAFPTTVDFRLDLSNMARRNQTTVPVVFGAVATLNGGTPSMNVHLYQGGVSKGSVNLTTSNTWVTTTFNLAASDLVYDIRIQRISGTTHDLKGVTCYVYDP